MKISTKGRYALRLMLDLAAHDGEWVTLKEIAERQNISKKYLEQIIPCLTRENYLLSNRGFQGGYRLARAPETYSAGEILRLTESSLAPVACLAYSPAGCDRRGDCLTLPLWKGLQAAIDHYLDGVTLSDLLNGTVKNAE